MTPEEAAIRFDKLLKTVQRELPKFIQERVANSTAGQIENRVTTTGKNFMGGSFKPYSRRSTLTSGTTAWSSKIWRKLADSPEKRRQLNWVTIKRQGRNIRLFELKGGYRQVRELEGFQVNHKDFTFTTQMWRGFGVKKVSRKPNEFIVTLGGRNAESQNKINWNSRREGVNIINISDQELQFLAKDVDRELQKYINKFGLA